MPQAVVCNGKESDWSFRRRLPVLKSCLYLPCNICVVGILGAQLVKNSPAMQETPPSSIPESGRFPGVRKHLTRGFLCAVLDLSGTLWPLLLPEYSGIKRRGTPFPGLRNPGISHYGYKYPLPFYEP